MEVQEEGMVPVRPGSAEISSRARWVRTDHWLGRGPVRPVPSTTTRSVRAAMADQDGGRDPVRLESDVLLKEARWVRVDQEEGRGPVRGLNEMHSCVREIKVDQSGGRVPEMPLPPRSRDWRAVSTE